MAASKALTLVVTLLVVVVGGMYLLYMPGFADLWCSQQRCCWHASIWCDCASGRRLGSA